MAFQYGVTPTTAAADVVALDKVLAYIETSGRCNDCPAECLLVGRVRTR